MATTTTSPAATGDKVYTFNARARAADGSIVTRRAKASRRSDVLAALIAQDLVPLRVSGGPGAAATEIQVTKTAKHRSLVVVTRLMATMFEAGLNPLQALDVVINDCDDLVLRNALTEVREQVRNGVPLSQAMGSQPAFPPTIIDFVTAGEVAGDLRGAFERVADQYDAEDKLRAKVKKAMMYPMVVFVISSIVFAGMMLWLVPQFAESFVEIGGEGTKLPLLTRAVIGLSDILKFAIPIFLVLAVPGFIAYRANKNKDEVRNVVDPLKLKLPIFGNLFRKVALARFSRTLAGLMDAGVDRLPALDITAKTVGNVVFERAIRKAYEAQRAGQPLVDPFKADPLFPAMIVMMVQVGEQTGQTGPMLGRAAVIYDRDVERITDSLSALIEPLFLVVLGVMITTIVLAIYLPYLQLGTLI